MCCLRLNLPSTITEERWGNVCSSSMWGAILGDLRYPGYVWISEKPRSPTFRTFSTFPCLKCLEAKQLQRGLRRCSDILTESHQQVFHRTSRGEKLDAGQPLHAVQGAISQRSQLGVGQSLRNLVRPPRFLEAKKHQ